MRTIGFHKSFVPAALISLALLAFGVVGLLVKGINLGVDFQAGVNQYVQLAYPAATVSYGGTGTPVLSISDTALTVVFSGADVESRTLEWDLKTVGTVNDLATAMLKDGISLSILDGAGLSADLLVPTYQGTFTLGKTAVVIHRGPKTSAELFGSIEEVRESLKSIGTASVQDVGGSSSMQYMIRISDDGTNKQFSETIPVQVRKALETKFGENKVVVMRTDYVGSRFSKDLADNAWKLTLFTSLAILAYATVRFKMQYALGAVLAILHDGLIMVGFIVWTRMEFNTTSIAAILTILGFSINDTIVIFDRIRENRNLNPSEPIAHVLDRSISETLGRTFITALTTMLAVISLYLFTSGSIKDFALALIVGMISGTYSTIYIATGFVYLWDLMRGKRMPNAGKKVVAVE